MALSRRIGFTRFSRWGDNLGRATVTEASHVEALDGTDELTVTCAEELDKGEYIVWVDRLGCAHEHVVDAVERAHDSAGAPCTTATCLNSVAELWDDWVDDKRPSGTCTAALASILEGTRWEVGTCDQPGTATGSFYHESVREALAELADTWGGELETEIEHDGASVTARKVGLRALRGNQQSAKRFTWTKDITSIKREVASDNPKTRIYGFGKGVETEDGGYGRRLTFEDVNGGLAYVEDEEATAVFGHPDGEGNILPAVGSYVNEECEDADQLLEETKAELESAKEPKVTYTAEVVDLAAFGRDWEGVALGDSVAIIDKGFCDGGIRLTGRVSQIERDLLGGGATVTFGNLSDAAADMWQAVSQALQGASSTSALVDAVAGTSAGWLTQLQAALNERFQAGGSYQASTFELGSIWSNVPLDAETGLPLSAASNMWAINISGAGFRIASGLASDGQWDWTTFGTGEGFTAECVNAGIVQGGSNTWNLETGDLYFDQGRIQSNSESADGSYWDMTTGDVHLASYSTADDVSEALSGYYTKEETSSLVSTSADAISLSVSQALSGYATAEYAEGLAESISTVETSVSSLTLTAESLQTSVASLQASWATCSTAAATADKAASCSGFVLASGAVVCVKFTYRNTASGPTLNVNSTGAKAIWYGSAAITSDNYWAAGATVTLVYSGSYWYVSDAGSLSAITQLADSISLSVSTSGSTASITLSVDGESVETEFATRAAFANDTSSISVSAGRVTFNAGTFVVAAGPASLSDYGNSGMYITAASGASGVMTSNGSAWTRLQNGRLYGTGGGGTSETGYICFNNYWTDTGVYGTRVAGSGCIALLAPYIGVGAYYSFSSNATVSTGQSGSLTVITGISATWSRISLSGVYEVDDLCRDLSISWTYKTITFTKGLMTSSL